MINKQVWKLEGIWWLFTAIVVVAVMLPIFTKVPDFPFIGYNIIYIVLAITFTRYIFLLRHTPLARSIVFKLIVIFSAIIVTILLIDGISEFQRLLDEQGYLSFLGHLPGDKAGAMAKYIRAEYVFFGVSTIICCVIMPIRMIISIWRQKNRDTV